MRLVFKKPHLSIREFDDVELSDFTILTGVNGSGKTHLLQSLANGSTQIDEIIPQATKYFDYKSFRVDKAEGGLNPQQRGQQQNQAWQYFSQVPKGQVGWKGLAAKIYTECFVKTDENGVKTDIFDIEFPKNKSIWTVKWEAISEELWVKVKEYRKQVKDKVFRSNVFRSNQHCRGTAKALMSSHKPIHLVTKFEFDDNFIPVKPNDTFVYSSLGAIFSNHLRNKFKWIAERVSQDVTITWEDAEREFDQITPEPWAKFNEILTRINQLSPNPEVFDFQIQIPELKVNLENFKSIRVNPLIRDNNTQGLRSFQTLSSGEQVLLALAMTLYECNESLTMPELMLLDEVDASLHPSMTIALLETVKTAFIDEGIKVILATHSPSTIALAPENSIYVVNKGNSSKKITQQSKPLAMDLVSEGYITFDENKALRILSHIIENTEKPILFVEGKTDKIILQNAWSKLFPEKSMPFEILDVFDCFFLINLFKRGEIFDNYPNLKFVGLIDFDDAYKNLAQKFSDNKEWSRKIDNNDKSVTYVHENNRGVVATLSVPEFRHDMAGHDLKDSMLSIELMFENDIVEKYCKKTPVVGGGHILLFKNDKKTKFAEMTASLEAEKFHAFKALFSRLKEHTIS